MKRKYSIAITAVMALLFVVGLAVLLNAPTLGSGAAEAMLPMDTERFYLLMRSAIGGYQTFGTLLAAVGGLGALWFGGLLLRQP